MRCFPLFLVLLLSAASATSGEMQHALDARLLPLTGELVATDVITLPAAATARRHEFELLAGLKIVDADPPVQRVSDTKDAGGDGRARYAVRLAAGQTRIMLRYQGSIKLPAQSVHRGFGRDQEASNGVISADGVYLDGNSGWYPAFDDALLTFSLDVELPPGWTAISQGVRSRHTAEDTRTREHWQETQPQEEIYLIAAAFHEYRAGGGIDKMVLLREDDPALAQKYLAVMDEYLDLYSRLLGPYPYGKFALVENSWESGYGMPSFTLLGPRVIRLPFILRSSFPHEILHNWWGNGVYVDGRGGNWSEGLTAYLADHLLQERNGAGAAYRRDALLRYTNYVAEQADFPLAQFRARHSDATQAVGYDKALMFFHALRLQLGDAHFIAALRQFYHDELFRFASWSDLRRAFEREAKTSLRLEFEQGLQRSGAPALRVIAARAAREGGGDVLKLTLEQTQAGPAYQLRVPVAVTIAGNPTSIDRVLVMRDKRLDATLRLPGRPLHVAVDPDFDVFRRLDATELPPTLSEALAADRLTIVLPAAAAPPQRQAYEQLARTWASSAAGMQIVWDRELDALPNDRAVWLFGWENRWRPELGAALTGLNVTLSDDHVRLADTNYSRTEYSVVLAGRRSGQALVWLGADNSAALPGLARKLPHYGSASHLVFRGDEPTNVLKGQWPVLSSPLAVNVIQADGKVAAPVIIANHRPRADLTQAIGDHR